VSAIVGARRVDTARELVIEAEAKFAAIFGPGPCAFCSAHVEPDEESGIVYFEFYKHGTQELRVDNHAWRFTAPEATILTARACKTCAESLTEASIVGEATRLLDP